MQKNTRNGLWISLTMIIIITTVTGCKQPYVYPVSATVTNFLHVEGVINTTGDTTAIVLSRTVKLTDTVASNPEFNAEVSVESPNGDHFTLTEGLNGIYTYPNFNFLPAISGTWRLDIKTVDGKIYQSDFVPIKNAAPVDSLYYREEDNGIRIYCDTHDPANNTRYYRWDYDETWVVHSVYNSYLKVQTVPVKAILDRTVADQIDSCWVSGRSSTLLLNSSAKLSQDVVKNNPLDFVSAGSEKLFGTYSILLHQHALTKEAFEYWQNLKKNTEQLGSIFDAQPSQIQGNIHCISKTSEPVLGYLSAGADSRKRILVKRISLHTFPQPPRMPGCKLDTLKIADLPIVFYSTATLVDAVYDAHHVLVGYSFSASRPCVDCTLKGTNVKPDFWR